MQGGGCAGDRRFRRIRRAAVPVRDHAARAADHRDQRRDVPRVHDWIHGDIRPAGRHQQVTVAVAPGAHEFRALLQRVVARAVLILGRIQRIARHQRGVFKPLRGTATHRPAVQLGGLSVANYELAEDRLMNAAEHRLALVE